MRVDVREGHDREHGEDADHDDDDEGLDPGHGLGPQDVERAWPRSGGEELRPARVAVSDALLA